MPRRVRKRYVVLGALVLAVLVAPVAATQVRWNGRLGFRATGPGIFRVRGVDVQYRERWPAVEVKRLTHTGVLVVGCAVPAGAKRADCRVPSMTP